jgi:hypothetical protein
MPEKSKYIVYLKSCLTILEWASECCTYGKWANFKLYHAENKFQSMRWYCPLITRPTHRAGDEDEVRFVLDQNASLDIYSWLKQHSVERHIAPLRHIIVIPRQRVFLVSSNFSYKVNYSCRSQIRLTGWVGKHSICRNFTHHQINQTSSAAVISTHGRHNWHWPFVNMFVLELCKKSLKIPKRLVVSESR